jgi:hypothetical protein
MYLYIFKAWTAGGQRTCTYCKRKNFQYHPKCATCTLDRVQACS